MEALFDEQKELTSRLEDTLDGRESANGRDVMRGVVRAVLFVAAVALAYFIGYSSN